MRLQLALSVVAKQGEDHDHAYNRTLLIHWKAHVTYNDTVGSDGVGFSNWIFKKKIM